METFFKFADRYSHLLRRRVGAGSMSCHEKNADAHRPNEILLGMTMGTEMARSITKT
jgi:hypothetical protein